MSRFFLRLSLFLLGTGLLIWSRTVFAQHSADAATGEEVSQETASKMVIFTTQQDHQNMLEQLGITQLRPGRNANENAPNAANYTEANANQYPNLPDVMQLSSGEQVTSPEQWWKTRRLEIIELLEREVYGRVPGNVPGVKWEVRETREIKAGGKRAIQKHLIGVVDNAACPEIKVNISMSLTLHKTEKMPAVNVEMLYGELAWRQHNGGHTDEPNVLQFIKWADKHLAKTAGKAANQGVSPKSPHKAIKRTDPKSIAAHEQLLAKARQGRIDVYFEGDSITRRWGATDYPKFLAQWKKHFYGRNAANFGWGGDTTQNILWRLQNGELDGVSPKVIVLQAGTNNLPWTGPADQAKVDEVVTGLEAIIRVLQQKAPDATIVLTGVFLRSQNMSLKETIAQMNTQLSKLDDGTKVRFLNINDKLADAQGKLLKGMSSDGLHLEEKGYEVWAEALKPILTEIMGPPAAEDHSPPPTGDPSAARNAGTG
jgi:lysophospholipase L1-like esterase